MVKEAGHLAVSKNQRLTGCSKTDARGGCGRRSVIFRCVKYLTHSMGWGG
jgi:hypothetical protein